MIINFDLKSNLFEQTSLLKYEEKKYESDLGYDMHEWGPDDSEQLEWERYYDVNEKWRDENEDEHALQDQI